MFDIEANKALWADLSYRRGFTKAHLMDCNVGMKAHRDLEFDLAPCDIPYGIDVGNMQFSKELKKSVKQKNGNRLNPNTNNRIQNFGKSDWDKIVPGQEYFDELRRVSRHQIIFGVDYVSWEGLGPGRIKWNKGVAEGVSFKGYERAYCSMIDYELDISLLWSGMQQALSLSKPMTVQGNKKLNEVRIHPCHKPVLLYKMLFMMFAQPGWNILDTHMGSGSSRIACFDMGLGFTGYETEIVYFLKEEKRFLQHTQQCNAFYH